jgi:hypothetical protein
VEWVAATWEQEVWQRAEREVQPVAVLVALARIGAIEGLTIQLAGAAPHDKVIAERVILGALGLPPAASDAVRAPNRRRR